MKCLKCNQEIKGYYTEEYPYFNIENLKEAIEDEDFSHVLESNSWGNNEGYLVLNLICYCDSPTISPDDNKLFEQYDDSEISTRIKNPPRVSNKIMNLVKEVKE